MTGLSFDDEMIALQGESVAVKVVAEGALDSYGDPAEDWDSGDFTETVIIQKQGRGALNSQLTDIAGDTDTGDRIAMLQTTTAIVRRNIIVRTNGQRLWVEKRDPVTEFGAVVHYEAFLRLQEDG